MSYRIVIPSRNTDAFLRTMSFLFKTHPDLDPGRVIVIGGMPRHDVDPDLEFHWIDQKNPFGTAQAWNEGASLFPNEDVAILSDDVKIESEGLFDHLASLSGQFGHRAIWTPAITGYDFGHKNLKPGYEIRREFVEVPFVCPYIPRRILDAVGPFDETFHGYGKDDFDFCVRTVKKGFRIYVESYYSVYHIPGQSEWRDRRTDSGPTIASNTVRMREKHGFGDPHEFTALGKEWAKLPLPPDEYVAPART